MKFVKSKLLMTLLTGMVLFNTVHAINVVLVYKWKLKGFESVSEDQGSNYDKEDLQQNGWMAVNYDTDTGEYTGAEVTKYWKDSSGKWVETKDFIDGVAVFQELVLTNERATYLVINGFNNQENAEMYSGKVRNVRVNTTLGSRVLTIPTSYKGQACWNATVYQQLVKSGYGDVYLKLDKASTNTANNNAQTVDAVMREKRSQASSKGYVNRDPVAVDDSVTIVMDTISQTITVLTNDYDPQNAKLYVTAIVSSPSHGTATINTDGTISYTPATGWFGVDQFSYMVTNQYGGSDTGTVTVTVTYNKETELVSITDTSSGTNSNAQTNPCYENGISSNGRFVVYRVIEAKKTDTAASVKAASGESNEKIYIYDRGQAGGEDNPRLVNETDGGGIANIGSQIIALNGNIVNADGKRIVFASEANNLLEDLKDTGMVYKDTNGFMDVFIRNLSEQTSTSSSSLAKSTKLNKSFPKGVSVDPATIVLSVILGSNPVAGTNDSISIINDTSVTQYIDITAEYTKAPSAAMLLKKWISNLDEFSHLVPANGTANFQFIYKTDDLDIGEYECVVTCQNFGKVRITLEVTDIPVRRISVDDNDYGGNGNSYPGASAGAHSTFYSEANSLVAGDTNGKMDVFVYTILSANNHNTIRASVSTNGSEGNGDSKYPAISDTGRFIVFSSNSTNLIDNKTLNGFYQVFLHDRDSDGNGTYDEAGGTSTTLISQNTAGEEGNGDSLYPNIVGSDTTYYITYQSTASNIDSSDTNGVSDVFVYTSTSGSTTKASVSSSGAESNGNSIYPSLILSGSKNQLFVVFQSEASNLVGSDNNARYDIFLRNIATGQTTLVTRNSDGDLSNDASRYPSVGSDGNYLYISYTSDATNLVTDDNNGVSQVYVGIEQSE